MKTQLKIALAIFLIALYILMLIFIKDIKIILIIHTALIILGAYIILYKQQ